MKRLVLLTITLLPIYVLAQTVTDSQRQAIFTKYPALEQQGSPLHAKFIALYNEAKQKSPALFADPHWPMILADRAADGEATPPNHPTTPVAKIQEVRAPFEWELQDPEKFFNEFHSKGHPKPRDQFETQQEYEARLPNPFDNTQVIYFVAAEDASFSYDIDKQQLTIVGGTFKFPDYNDYKIEGLAPICIHTKYDDKGTFEASNSFGKTVTVERAFFYHYFLHLTNGKAIPPAFKVPSKMSYDKSEQLALTISMPRDQAKDVAPNLSLVCGVRLLGYAKSTMECTTTKKATIDSPSELAAFAYGIDAELVSLHVINKQTKEELARWPQ